VTIDPSAANLNGTAFSADALTGTEVSVITNGPPSPGFSWNEIGYLIITGSMLNGAAVVPTGLGSTYTMYFGFNIQGYQSSLTSSGHATSMTMDLYGVNGVSAFGFDAANNAIVVNPSTPTLLATLSSGSLSTTATIENLSPLALDLNASLVAGFDSVVAGFFASPFSMTVDGEFSHPAAGVSVLYGGGAFMMNGGNDVLSFVPEPTSATILAAALLAAIAVARWLAPGKRQPIGERPPNANRAEGRGSLGWFVPPAV
jgi:hypothetical protein